MDAVFPYRDGLFVRVNPMLNGKGTSDKEVALYRDILVEADEGKFEDQLGAIRCITLPISSIVCSAGRRVQARVRIDAPDEATYRGRFGILRQYCVESLGLKMDVKNINPSRYSRFPGAKRVRRDHETHEKILDTNGQEIIDIQTLLGVNIPGKSWDEWVESLPVDDGDNTEWFDLDALFDFDRENDPDNVIGNRWICRGDSFILQGYTGIGKSSFVLQIAIYLALGKPLFGCIKVKGPLKILIIQAENNAGDMAEPLQDICEYALKLSDEEKQKLKANLIIGRQSTKSGAVAFASYVEMLIRKHKPDVCIFDPLLSYFGKDIYSQEAASEFFRAYLQPIQNRTGIIMGFVHHLGKPPKSSDQRQGPVLYSGLGSSDIFNWAREVMTLVPDEDFHKLDLGKRGFRAGIVDEQGKPITEIRVQRASEGRCYWSVAASQPKAGDQTKARNGIDLDRALEQVPLVEPEHKDAVIKKISVACKVGINPARQALTELILSEKVEDVDIENPKKTGKKGRPYAGVVRTRRETS
jgi:RecA-family ATPase